MIEYVFWRVLCLVVAMFPFVLENMDTGKSAKSLVDDEEEEENETQKEYHKEKEDDDDCNPKIIPLIVAMDSLRMHSQDKIGKWIK